MFPVERGDKVCLDPPGCLGDDRIVDNAAGEPACGYFLNGLRVINGLEFDDFRCQVNLILNDWASREGRDVFGQPGLQLGDGVANQDVLVALIDAVIQPC